MRRQTEQELVNQTAQVLLMTGAQLVPMRREYSSRDLVDQMVYMLTVFKTIPLEFDDPALDKPKARMVEYLEEARAE